jgi:Raf kinase inhibitor-like YbhB/YbcL family protein
MQLNTHLFTGRHNAIWVFLFLSVLCLSAVLPAGCQSSEPLQVQATLSLSSAAFQDGGIIPDKYSCQGQDVSPPLSWGEPSAGTRSLALVTEDLDSPGGRFTHWVLFNIPLDIRELNEAVSPQSRLPNGALEGKNDFGKIGYGGPCPPSGKSHRYQFTIYALDTALNLEAGASKKPVLDALEGHILARAQLTGLYQR